MKSQKISSENYHFYSREKSLYIAWACFRDVVTVSPQFTPVLGRLQILLLAGFNTADFLAFLHFSSKLSQ